jgi:hypothetical protein
VVGSSLVLITCIVALAMGVLMLVSPTKFIGVQQRLARLNRGQGLPSPIGPLQARSVHVRLGYRIVGLAFSATSLWFLWIMVRTIRR